MSQFQTLLNQFHTRYPMGSVISELAATHEQNYVVRALVQVGGMTLSTGMAAAPDVEQAEDRAKVRALEALHLGNQTANSIPANLRDSQTTSIPPLAKPESSEPIASLPSPSPNIDLSTSLISFEEEVSAPQRSSQPTRSPSVPELSPLEMDFSQTGNAASIDSLPLPSLEDDSLPGLTTPRTIASPTPKPEAKRKSEPKSKAAAPVDDESIVQEARLQTDVELRRVGWTPDEGRKHLMETYGKRSRLHLTDEELLDFLHYLKSLPSAIDSPF